ncbi:hypothetical protein BDP27DRAFT_1361508 [Rhodocollybia butyracea]|uniref:Uncharacterized protein n=1 Tax=Rhodocollybia butyracea TaxID=206335 RepID=A0A9P5Q1F0_9AGAR|nr:hypothetical protein BDP27DRAFT_1361508 [Rhodocollybia butyracea]
MSDNSCFSILRDDPWSVLVIPPRKVPVKNVSPRATVPSHIWMLDGMEQTSMEGTLIRQEYIDLIYTILKWMKLPEASALENERYAESTKQSAKGRQLDRETQDKPKQTPILDHSDTKQEENEERNATRDQPDSSSSAMVPNIDLSDPHAIPLVTASDINTMDVFPNPFALVENQSSTTSISGLIATGLPGIGDYAYFMPNCLFMLTALYVSGKMRFLFLIWHLRRAENLPTLIMTDPRFLWKDNLLYLLKVPGVYPGYLSKMIPRNTWCLVDSNRDLTDHIWFFPREFRIEWGKKQKDVYYLVMKPWSAEELISGLQLQLRVRFPPTVNSLVDFRAQYGGSARDAYRYASNISLLEEEIEGAALAMNERAVKLAFTSRPSSLRLPEEAGYMLLSVFLGICCCQCFRSVTTTVKSLLSPPLPNTCIKGYLGSSMKILRLRAENSIIYALASQLLGPRL